MFSIKILIRVNVSKHHAFFVTTITIVSIVVGPLYNMTAAA